MSQARYWLLTIPHHLFTPYLPNAICYIKGQLESGSETGYLHWQILAVFSRGVRLAAVKKVFGIGIHAEQSRSSAANEYVWKDDTAIEGTRFELGELPKKRNSSKDWDEIWENAKRGRYESIPRDVLIRSYRTIKDIAKDHMTLPQALDDVCGVWIYGESGVGKSRLARDTYPGAYWKPCDKWWDGYQGEDYVIMDDMDPSHKGLVYYMKLWMDFKPLIADTKFGKIPIRPKKFIVTSQYSIDEIWDDPKSRDAIRRRCIGNIIHKVQLNASSD